MANNTDIHASCCLIFSKTPELGKTKTRLIPTLGATGANQLHIKLSNHTLKLPKNTPDIDFQYHYTKTNKTKHFTDINLPDNITTRFQIGSNLGERMYNATHSCLKHYSHCLIIGTDCPEISPEYLLSAQYSLKSGHDIVIGPADDGGYVLIGLSQSNKQLFTNITWGSDTVLVQTLSNIEQMKLSYQLLETLRDIDTENDLKYLNKLNIL